MQAFGALDGEVLGQRLSALDAGPPWRWPIRRAGSAARRGLVGYRSKAGVGLVPSISRAVAEASRAGACERPDYP